MTKNLIKIGSSPLPVNLYYSRALFKNTTHRYELVKVVESMFNIYVYLDKSLNREHIVILKNVNKLRNIPLRIHSSCITAETFHASNCDCHDQLNKSLVIAHENGCGGVIWLYQEGRGNGLVAKIKQIKLMLENNLDTVTAYKELGYPPDQRDYSAAIEILNDLKIRSIKLITNNPDKINQLKRLGFKVNGRIPCIIKQTNVLAIKDLQIKVSKLGHIL